jgi:hypothetical protein
MMKIESTIENGWSLKLHQTQQVDASPSLSLVPNLLGNHSLYTVFLAHTFRFTPWDINLKRS